MSTAPSPHRGTTHRNNGGPNESVTSDEDGHRLPHHQQQQQQLLYGYGHSDCGDGPALDAAWIVKLSGVPWSATVDDIVDFLDGVAVHDGVHLCTSTRIYSAFVECASATAYRRAFASNNRTMGGRYIEVFSASREEMRAEQLGTVVRLRGLPWRTAEQEIVEFFSGLEVARVNGVHLHADRMGRATGEAFVQFTNGNDYIKAFHRQMNNIGHRFIEIFRSSTGEMQRSMMRSAGCYSDGGGYNKSSHNQSDRADHAELGGNVGGSWLMHSMNNIADAPQRIIPPINPAEIPLYPPYVAYIYDLDATGAPLADLLGNAQLLTEHRHADWVLVEFAHRRDLVAVVSMCGARKVRISLGNVDMAVGYAPPPPPPPPQITDRSVAPTPTVDELIAAPVVASCCVLCEQQSAMACANCGAPYCSKRCQFVDWPHHSRGCTSMPVLEPTKHFHEAGDR